MPGSMKHHMHHKHNKHNKHRCHVQGTAQFQSTVVAVQFGFVPIDIDSFLLDSVRRTQQAGRTETIVRRSTPSFAGTSVAGGSVTSSTIGGGGPLYHGRLVLCSSSSSSGGGGGPFPPQRVLLLLLPLLQIILVMRIVVCTQWAGRARIIQDVLFGSGVQ